MYQRMDLSFTLHSKRPRAQNSDVVGAEQDADEGPPTNTQPRLRRRCGRPFKRSAAFRLWRNGAENIPRSSTSCGLSCCPRTRSPPAVIRRRSSSRSGLLSSSRSWRSRPTPNEKSLRRSAISSGGPDHRRTLSSPRSDRAARDDVCESEAPAESWRRCCAWQCFISVGRLQLWCK